MTVSSVMEGTSVKCIRLGHRSVSPHPVPSLTVDPMLGVSLTPRRPEPDVLEILTPAMDSPVQEDPSVESILKPGSRSAGSLRVPSPFVSPIQSASTTLSLTQLYVFPSQWTPAPMSSVPWAPRVR